VTPIDKDALASFVANISPFTIALVTAGWPGAGNLINVAIITTLLSSVNSSIYICSRSLLSLATLGRAPKIFAKMSANGVPIYTILFSNFLGLLALLHYIVGTGKVFACLVDIRGAATFVAWAFIRVAHIRMRKASAAHGLDLNDLPYRALWFPYGAWLVLFINIFLVLVSSYTTLIPPFQAVNFVFNYIVLIIFVLLLIFWKLYKTKWVPLMEINMATGRREDIWRPNPDGKPKASILLKFKRFLLG
jgi:yeast amino acid transporter